jgi:hypothetical protein
MLKQSADEIEVALTVLFSRPVKDEERPAHSLLLAIVERMRFAAKVAEQGPEGGP